MNYVRCINNQGYEASLTEDTVYKSLPDSTDRTSLRVVDNEGEDYLYDDSRFEAVNYAQTRNSAADAVTVYLDPLIKAILQAEALAAQTSVSALLRGWIDERLDLPEMA